MDSQFVEAICQAVVEILGEKEAFLVLKEMGVSSFNVADSSRYSLVLMGRELTRKHDRPTAMGLMIRIGRSSLTFIRRYFNQISELGGIDNRLKPINKRFPYSLDILARTASAELGEEIKVIFQPDLSFEWQIMTNDFSFTPYFHFGLLEEFSYWLDARKDYQIVYAADETDNGFANLTIRVLEKE